MSGSASESGPGASRGEQREAGRDGEPEGRRGEGPEGRRGERREPSRSERLELHHELAKRVRQGSYWRPRSRAVRGSVRRRRTPLEYGIMCLIARAPMTGSEICRLLRRYPLAGTGKSPGAVYPALYRLADAGLVCGQPRFTHSHRSIMQRWRYRQAAAAQGPPVRERGTVQEFGLTRDGVVGLRAWATRRVTRREVLERPEHLMLRFVLCTGLAGPTAARRVALQCRRVCRELALELAEEVERARGHVSPGARLAMECAQAEFEVRVTWARRAEAELARQAVREPDLDLPSPAREVAEIYRKVVAQLDEETRGMLRWPGRDGLPPVPPTRRGVLSLLGPDGGVLGRVPPMSVWHLQPEPPRRPLDDWRSRAPP